MSEIINNGEEISESENILWDKNRESIRADLFGIIENKCKFVDNKDEELNILMKKEETFLKLMDRKVEEFVKNNLEKNHVLLFDIDETIGKGFTTKKINEKNENVYITETVLRPSIKIILEHFRDIYPKLSYGLITTRGGDNVKNQLKDKTNLQPIADFITTEYIFSTNDEEVKRFGDNFSYKHKSDEEQLKYFNNHPLISKQISPNEMYQLEDSGTLGKLELLNLFIKSSDNPPEVFVVDDWKYPNYLKNGVSLDKDSGFYPSIY